MHLNELELLCKPVMKTEWQVTTKWPCQEQAYGNYRLGTDWALEAAAMASCTDRHAAQPAVSLTAGLSCDDQWEKWPSLCRLDSSLRSGSARSTGLPLEWLASLIRLLFQQSIVNHCLSYPNHILSSVEYCFWLFQKYLEAADKISHALILLECRKRQQSVK